MDQASLVIRKIQTEFMTNANILRELVPRNPIHTQGNALRCELKNGSYLEARTVNTARGLRAKVIVVDEAPEVTQDRLSSVVEPIRNYKRMSMTQLGLEDYQSKIVSITSACLKSNYYSVGVYLNQRSLWNMNPCSLEPSKALSSLMS